MPAAGLGETAKVISCQLVDPNNSPFRSDNCQLSTINCQLFSCQHPLRGGYPCPGFQVEPHLQQHVLRARQGRRTSNWSIWPM